VAKQSDLFEFLQGQGAVYVETEGWLLPRTFDSTEAEYRAVRGAVGLIDMPHRHLLQFTGADRVSFLQGMLSNDVRALQMFEGQHAAILTQQGKMIAEVRVLCALNSIYLDFWEPRKETILAHLNRYLVADEVEITDPSENWHMLSVQGPRTGELLAKLFNAGPLPSNPAHHGMIQFDGSPICVVRANHFDEAGYDLIVAKSAVANVAQRLTEIGEEFSAAWIGEEVIEILRVEAGVPRHGVDYTEDNLLLEIDLKDAVSFTKGCYLGQEVVERIRSRGHVNKRLSGLLLDGDDPARSGAPLLAGGKEAGKITSSVRSPALRKPIALGYVQKDFWASGTELTVADPRGARRATVSDLPFVSGSTAAVSS
jgi:folate-binding protein YgfZ